jgi:hypothetical protein
MIINVGPKSVTVALTVTIHSIQGYHYGNTTQPQSLEEGKVTRPDTKLVRRLMWTSASCTNKCKLTDCTGDHTAVYQQIRIMNEAVSSNVSSVVGEMGRKT